MGGPPSVSPHMSPKLRPLMDIPTHAPAVSEASKQSELVDGNLGEKIKETEEKISTLKEQIHQSEQNLDAQKNVTDSQVEEATESTIRAARYENLELLSHDTGISLNDIDAMIQPIIDSCTKDTIGSGKVWIFQYATNHDRNSLLARYLAYKVTEQSANFQLKLHLIYLMNDVVHHCVRKNNDDLKGSLESVAVEMFCSAWRTCSAECDDPSAKQGKLTKLIKLWQDKSIFSQVTLGRMRDVDETWRSCQEQLRIDYEQAVKRDTQHLIDTYKSYSDQHTAFVNHAENSIKSLQARLEELKEQQSQAQSVPAPSPALPPPALTGPPPNIPSEIPRKGTRGSRWDTGSDGQTLPHQPNEYAPAPTGMMLPDFSKPPPGFGGPPPGLGIPPPMQDNSLIPTLPYYDLPAGLMVPLIKLED